MREGIIELTVNGKSYRLGLAPGVLRPRMRSTVLRTWARRRPRIFLWPLVRELQE